MENFSKMCLEYEKMSNNLTTHKRRLKQHNISKDMLKEGYETYLVFYQNKLESINREFDVVGFEDLENYEKWLENVRKE